MSGYAPTQEVRYSVVMFGGVSLAIYMNGIAEELLHLVRSTAPGPGGVSPLLSGSELRKTENVYRKIGQLLHHGRIPGEKGDENGEIRTRFLIDLLSGTSAGGINAVYLAKALANDQDLQVLHDLWLAKADIDTLMNDDRSERSRYPSADPPTSLLNSQRMYGLLLEAFDAMDRRPARRGLVDELDLFVTATDLNGLATPIELTDTVVEERVHKVHFRFMYSPRRLGSPNDFSREYNEMLAFAARCTSSFPFAFEPMKFNDIGKFRPETPLSVAQAIAGNKLHLYRKFLGAFEAFGRDLAFPLRPLADGGYLHNKPFSFVVDEQRFRQTDYPVHRKLLFLDPFPELRDKMHRADQSINFVENTLAAASTLPRAQPIREDIERVNTGNRKVRAAQSLALALEGDIKAWVDQHVKAMQKEAERKKGLREEEAEKLEWQNLPLSAMILRSGPSYAVYHRLRISAVTDDLALLVTRLVGFNDDSDELYAIRLLIHWWRVEHYRPDPGNSGLRPENYFLFEYDLGYRFRRLSYFRERIDKMLALVRTADEALRRERIRDAAREIDQDGRDAILAEAATARGQKGLVDRLMTIRGKVEGLRGGLLRMREQLWLTYFGQTTDETAQALRQGIKIFLHKTSLTAEDLKWILRPARAEDCEKRAKLLYTEGRRDSQSPARPISENITKAANQLAADLQDGMKLARSGFQAALGLQPETKINGGPTEPLARLLWLIYEYFDARDLLVYPVQRDHLGFEDSVTEIYRISPLDAGGIRGDVNKLTGTSIGAFGAFLDPGFRQNDILWGRLDGAERIIKSLLPDEQDDQLRKGFMDEAYRIILQEEFAKGSSERFFELLMRALDVPLAADRGGKLGPEEFLARARERIRDDCPGVVRGLLMAIPSDAEVLKAFKQFYQRPASPSLKTNVRRLRRAVLIVGRMLEGLGTGDDPPGAAGRWLIRFGGMVTRLVDFALPGDLWYMITRHVMQLLYASEVVLILSGSFFGAGPVASIGWWALVLTLLLDVVLRLIGERGRGGRTARSVLIPVLVLIGAAVVLVWSFAGPIANMLIGLATWLKGRA
jgi:patatin-related protein